MARDFDAIASTFIKKCGCSRRLALLWAGLVQRCAPWRTPRNTQPLAYSSSGRRARGSPKSARAGATTSAHAIALSSILEGAIPARLHRQRRPAVKGHAGLAAHTVHRETCRPPPPAAARTRSRGLLSSRKPPAAVPSSEKPCGQENLTSFFYWRPQFEKARDLL